MIRRYFRRGRRGNGDAAEVRLKPNLPGLLERSTDADMLYLSANVALFGTEILGLELDSQQVALLNSTSRRVILN